MNVDYLIVNPIEHKLLMEELCRSAKEGNQEAVFEMALLNKLYIDGFQRHLEKASRSAECIARTVADVDFYLNEFLPGKTRHTLFSFESGLNEFFLSFLPTHRYLCTPSRVSHFLRSFRKFMAFLIEKEAMPKKSGKAMERIIKRHESNWVLQMRKVKPNP